MTRYRRIQSPYVGVKPSDHRFVGRGLYRIPNGSMEPFQRLKSGWDLVSPKTFAFLYFAKKRDTFIGNQHGRFSITTDKNRNSIISQHLFLEYFNDPNCPQTCAIAKNPYNPDDIRFMLVLKPIEDLLACKTQLFFENMDATEQRNTANEHTERALSIAKAESLVRASTPSIEKIKSGLDANDRVTYTQIKAEILELMSEGKIHPLSNLEVERITLMRMVELKGLMDVLATDTHATTDGEDGLRSTYTADAVKMMNLMRQIGNEAQRMTENSSTAKKNGKSAFQALEELVKSGQVKLEITKAEQPPEPIDADYKMLLGDDAKQGE